MDNTAFVLKELTTRQKQTLRCCTGPITFGNLGWHLKNFYHLPVGIASFINKQYTLSYLRGSSKTLVFSSYWHYNLSSESALKLHLLHVHGYSQSRRDTQSIVNVRMVQVLLKAYHPSSFSTVSSSSTVSPMRQKLWLVHCKHEKGPPSITGPGQ